MHTRIVGRSRNSAAAALSVTPQTRRITNRSLQSVDAIRFRRVLERRGASSLTWLQAAALQNDGGICFHYSYHCMLMWPRARFIMHCFTVRHAPRMHTQAVERGLPNLDSVAASPIDGGRKKSCLVYCQFMEHVQVHSSVRAVGRQE